MSIDRYSSITHDFFCERHIANIVPKRKEKVQVNSYQTNRFSIQVSNSDHHPTILIGSAFQNEKVHLQESRLSLHKKFMLHCRQDMKNTAYSLSTFRTLSYFYFLSLPQTPGHEFRYETSHYHRSYFRYRPRSGKTTSLTRLAPRHCRA